MAHEELKAQYEQDALWHPMPWELWEYRHKEDLVYYQLIGPVLWFENLVYRRKPGAPGINCIACKRLPGCYNSKCPLAQKEEPNLLTDLKSLLNKWDVRGGKSGSDKYEDALYTCIDELSDVIIKHKKAVKAESI